MGLYMKAHYQGSHVIMSLVMTECAKPNEYNDWPMFGIQSMCPIVASDPMEKIGMINIPCGLNITIWGCILIVDITFQ